jgi:hypothetical protein
MTKLAFSANNNGTGTFVIASPDSNTNRTLLLPDATTTIVGTDTTQTLTNKSIDAAQLTGNVAAAQITSALNATGSAPLYACRAWVNFNGTGTPSIRGSGNVSSVTARATGKYTVNFSTAIVDANYSMTQAIGTNNDTDTAAHSIYISGTPGTTSANVNCTFANANSDGFQNRAYILLAFHR